MNKGINLATGNVIGIINLDDLFCDERAIENIMMEFDKNSKLDCIFC